MSQSPDLNAAERAFYMLKAKPPQNNQELKAAAVKHRGSWTVTVHVT